MLLISLIRHGQVDGEAALYGRTDVSLSQVGEAKLALSCHSLLPKLDLVISSPLKRCAVYAKNFAQQHQIDYQECPDFKEMNFGLLDGVPFDNVYKTKQWPLLEAFWQDPKQNALPQAESLTEFHSRVTSEWVKITSQLKQSKYKHVAIICHGGVIRMLIAYILNLDWSSPALFSQLKIDYASLSKIEYNSNAQLITIGQQIET